MRSTTKLVVAIGGLALSLTAGAGIASAAPDVSAIVNSTCTYPQVMAALNAQSPQMAKQISGNPAANAWLQALINSGPEPLVLFGLLFLTAFMITGTIAINVGPLTSASVPPAIAATATGLVVGIGEMVGGAIAPAVAGAMADSLGIAVIFKIAAVAIGVSILVVGFGIREPERR